MSVMTTTEKAGYDSAVTKLAGISTGADVTSAALVTAGTTTADVAAAALAKICGYTQIAKGTLTLGTGAVLSLTDASFAGKTAGGRGDLQGAAGVLGIVAGSFASSSAETGTGAGQAGLGSAAASGQPYNVSDFPGQNQFAQCVLLTSDRKPIPLVQMVAGSITDATAEVYGYLGFRSDLGADAKWRLRFYYRRSADGLEAPFTPTISLANCWLEVPENFLAPTLAPGFGLSQTTAGPAISPIPTLDKVPAPVAAVAGNAQEATGWADPTAAQSLATRAYVDAKQRMLATWGLTAAPATTANRFPFLGAISAAPTANQFNSEFVSPVAQTIAGIFVAVRGSVVATTLACTVLINGVSSACTVTLGSSATTASATGFSVAVAAGDVVGMLLVEGAATAQAAFNCTIAVSSKS